MTLSPYKPRCLKHNLVMMWFGVDKGKSKYRCAICVADAKLKIDQECAKWRECGRR
jgi:hypothetical protein